MALKADPSTRAKFVLENLRALKRDRSVRKFKSMLNDMCPDALLEASVLIAHKMDPSKRQEFANTLLKGTFKSESFNQSQNISSGAAALAGPSTSSPPSLLVEGQEEEGDPRQRPSGDNVGNKSLASNTSEDGDSS